MIDVRHLNFTYPNQINPTLKDVNLTVTKGEIFGFLGPSGAGKSTLQKILIGVLKDYEGDVQVLNQTVKQADSSFYQRLGVAFEMPNFYQKFTAVENLKFFQSFYKNNENEIYSLLDKLDLQPFADTRVSAFSKGMKMRLNVCRAFLHQPDIVFLDEPTSGLDPANINKVKQLIVEQKEAGKTIIITTHNMAVADSLCDRVAFVVDGEIKVIASPAQLKRQYPATYVTVTHTEHNKIVDETFELKHLGKNNRFTQLLTQNEILAIHSEEKTLEDIFLELTGRTLQ
ncbi:ABC transporter ATP-binding protein [Alkalihalobacterium bogoriense]|uniref:ABC transporter ATP-binding protein n=1 Tax=Alkalihalobacterium bogoriense TaxID=246272 RepID=UPI00047C43E6|nr:ABC transporter ATP-binding protein [Alkalihalobacterium bogoriense]